MNIDNISVNTGVICDSRSLGPTLAFMGGKQPERKKLSAPDELAAKNLRRIWEEKKRGLHLTQDKAADYFGFKTQAAISHYLRGYTPLNTDAVLGFSDLLKVSPEDIRPDIRRLLNAGLRIPAVGRDDVPATFLPTISVPRLSNVGSMGPGSELATHDHVVEQITLTEQWVNGITSRASFTRLRIIAAMGDSMEPTLRDGDFVLVDTGLTTVNVNGIFVLRANDRLYIKRIRQRMEDGVFEVRSDNERDGPPEELSGKHKINVVGRVIYAWNGKKF